MSADLLSEFEYLHRFLGRHGKHLGKGATSKVTTMMRKGCPEELYAVKEFRSQEFEPRVAGRVREEDQVRVQHREEPAPPASSSRRSACAQTTGGGITSWSTALRGTCSGWWRRGT